MKTLLQKLIPRRMADDSLVRAGNNADGGYLVPGKAAGCHSVVSIGIGGDVSFDLFFAQGGATVYQYDHTVAGVPQHQFHTNFKFHQAGWGCTYGTCRNLWEMLPEDATKPCLLKCDIEGVELPNLANLNPRDLEEYEFLVFELHDLGKLGEQGFRTQFARVVETLTKTHTPVHLHGNNYASVANVGNVLVPWVLEVTLRRGGEGSEPLTTYRNPLDFPNNPNAQDIDMDVLIATWL